MSGNMTYNDTLEFLFSQLPMFQRIGKAAYKANLDNTLALDAHLQHPHRKFRTIHIAGTNGKGSTSHALAAILQKAGYKTGLYTSPHLRDFRERIRVNGQMITEQAVVDFVAQNRTFFDQYQLSFFEMSVGLAFDYFAQQNIDVAVVEVGMGGRLDSTNIITPDLCVITNISFDHTEFLGDTLAKIAAEKAGIIKQGVPVVVGQSHPETRPVFEQTAKEKQAPILFADDVYVVKSATINDAHKQQFVVAQRDGNIVYPDLQLDLLGNYQQKNILTIVAAAQAMANIGYHITNKIVEQALPHAAHTTGLMGRWQILGSRPLIVCDTGHNADGWTQVLKQIQATPHRHLHFVLGVVGDKNVDYMLQMLPREATYYITQAQIPRALDRNILAQKCFDIGLSGKVFDNVPEAFAAAKQQATPDDMIFVGGSTFVVAEVV